MFWPEPAFSAAYLVFVNSDAQSLNFDTLRLLRTMSLLNDYKSNTSSFSSPSASAASVSILEDTAAKTCTACYAACGNQDQQCANGAFGCRNSVC